MREKPEPPRKSPYCEQPPDGSRPVLESPSGRAQGSQTTSAIVLCRTRRSVARVRGVGDEKAADQSEVAACPGLISFVAENHERHGLTFRASVSVGARAGAHTVQPRPHPHAGRSHCSTLRAGGCTRERKAVWSRPPVLDAGTRGREARDRLSLLEDAARSREVGDLLGDVLDLAGLRPRQELEVDQRLSGIPVGLDAEDLDSLGGQNRRPGRHGRVNSLVGSLPDSAARDVMKWVDVRRTRRARGHATSRSSRLTCESDGA